MTMRTSRYCDRPSPEPFRFWFSFQANGAHACGKVDARSGLSRHGNSKDISRIRGTVRSPGKESQGRSSARGLEGNGRGLEEACRQGRQEHLSVVRRRAAAAISRFLREAKPHLRHLNQHGARALVSSCFGYCFGHCQAFFGEPPILLLSRHQVSLPDACKTRRGRAKFRLGGARGSTLG
jgi:hypothetical protein